MSANCHVRDGDDIYILEGGKTPFILRGEGRVASWTRWTSSNNVRVSGNGAGSRKEIGGDWERAVLNSRSGVLEATSRFPTLSSG